MRSGAAQISGLGESLVGGMVLVTLIVLLGEVLQNAYPNAAVPTQLLPILHTFFIRRQFIEARKIANRYSAQSQILRNNAARRTRDVQGRLRLHLCMAQDIMSDFMRDRLAQ